MTSKTKIFAIFLTVVLSLFVLSISASAQDSYQECVGMNLGPGYCESLFNVNDYYECVGQGGDFNYCCSEFPDGCGTTGSSGSGSGTGNVPSRRDSGGSGGGSSGGSAGGSTGSGSDDLCPSDRFERVNGLCVPKATSKEGLLGASTVFEAVTIILRWLLTLAGVVATVFLIIGGYQYITAAGNEEAAEKGKKTLVNAIIGIVVVVLSIAIVTIITNTLGSTEPLGDRGEPTRII